MHVHTQIYNVVVCIMHTYRYILHAPKLMYVHECPKYCILAIQPTKT